MPDRVNLNVVLPVEILTTIIVDCVVNDRRFARPANYPTPTYLASVSLSISHVCRLWRNITLSPGGKRLWTHVPLRHRTTCVEAFMQRSHPLPVFLKIEANESNMETPVSTSLSALETALKYFDRIEAMILHFDVGNGSDFSAPDEFDYWVNDKYLKVLFLLDEHTFPALEYLSWTTYVETAPECFSPDLFNAAVPRSLRRLHLCNAEFGSSIPILRPPLTSLVIQQGGAWSCIDDFISTLLCMPSLETLAIMNEARHALHESESSQRHQLGSIALPCLKQLALYDLLKNVPLLFAYIRAPISCRIDLTMDFEDTRTEGGRYWEHWNTLHQALCAHFESFAFELVGMSGDGNDDGRFHLWASSPELPPLNLSFYTRRYQESNREDARLLRTLRSLILLPPLSRASTIVAQDIRIFEPALNTAHGDSGFRGRGPFHLFTAAREVIATRAAVEGLVHALIWDPDYPLMPALQKITIREVVFCDSDPHTIRPMFTNLISALVAREHLHSVQAMNVVDFICCGLTERAVGVLVKAVSNVEVLWDEKSLSPVQVDTIHSDLEHKRILEEIVNNAHLPY